MPNILIKTNDDKEYEVDVEIAQMSETIRDMMTIGDSREIFLENIDSSPLELVLKWCKHHKDDQFNEDMAQLSEQSDYPLFDFWDQMFIQKIEESDLFELMMASVYLNVKPLVDITAKAVAKLIVCKTPEDIRDQWDITCDFGPEEDEYLRKVNEWAEVKTSKEPDSILLSHFIYQKKSCFSEEEEEEMDEILF